MSAKHVRKATTAFCAWNDETVTDSDKAEGGTCEHDHSKDEYAESVLDNTPFSYAVADNTRPFCFTSTEARWLIRDGDRGIGDDRVKDRPRIPPEKDRRDRGPPPEQWKC